MRLPIALAVAVLSVSVLGADAAAPGFRYGVAAGEVTATSALLWTRAPARGTVRLEVDGPSTSVVQASATAANDLTVQVTVRGLRPATPYAYRFVQGGRTSPVGRFTTAPRPGARARVRFALTGDADATPVAGG